MAFKVSTFWKIFFLSLSTIPVCTLFNKGLRYLMQLGFHSLVIALTGVFFLLTYLLIIVYVCKQGSSKDRITNWHFYVFSLFGATSVVDIGIGLEQDKYISDFLSEYLKNGEPYLFCPFGKAICYFDGFIMNALYLYMIYAISNKKSYRTAAIYWAGTIIFSQVVTILGILWGKYGIFPSSILNIPYLVLPVVILWSLRHQRPEIQANKSPQLRLHQRPFDFILVLLLIICVVFTILRATAVMDNNVNIAQYYLNKIEPYLILDHPSPFIKVQILVYLFYFLPIYLLSIYGLIEPGCSWIPDLTLFHAGAMAEGQFALIITALHEEIPKELQVPDTFEAKAMFWYVNLLLLVVPHLLLARCHFSNKFFAKSNVKINKSKEKAKHN